MPDTTAAELHEQIDALRKVQATQTGTDAWDATQAEIVALEDRIYDLAGAHTWITSRCK